ncbi:efflux RND transporter permease subunit [uncultured Endozoicomonas sp.]|uniref:efflux RND transporter permease subunit n=1 Tax=uncultured Endozoicomonas sp. TaxID=432652 RepID=UPI002606BECC|nr:efflux RND transporter permease subunit [uncultured Endozoicomonas sp.]
MANQSNNSPGSFVDRFVDGIARLLISKRRFFGVLFILMTIGFSYSAMQTRFDAGFNKLIPMNHDYMKAFLDHGPKFSGANRIMVNLQWKGEGDIYNPEFMAQLKKATDEVFFIPGVNRTTVRSLYTPEVRYVEVTEFGFMGSEVIPSRFTADEAGLSAVRSNVNKSGQVGNLVSTDLKSAMVQAELLEFDQATGDKTNYRAVAAHLESIRTALANDNIEVSIIGFAKVMGDVMDGLVNVLIFFIVAFGITMALLWAYSRSLKLTLLAIAVALLPVIWLMGTLPLIGYGIDPMSVLVPFLIFSIGVSHAVQMTNTWKQDVLMGMTPIDAAESAFRKLAIPGTVALLANALGFMVIMVIDIPMVHELGVTACLGVAMMIVTNKMFMPIILSHLKLENMAFSGPDRPDVKHPIWWKLSALATPKAAMISLACMLVLLVGGTWQSRSLLTGDIGSGVPELRAESRYNKDNDEIARNYQIGMDVLSVYLETSGREEACLDWEVMNAVDRFDMHMRGVDGVQSVRTVAGLSKLYVSGNNEGNPRWRTLQRDNYALVAGARAAHPQQGLSDNGCKIINMMVYLDDHQDATLKHVSGEIQKYLAEQSVSDATFRMAGGNAGVAVATNQAVETAEAQMLTAIFSAITLLCWITFRSWRGVLCVVVPLILVTILCNALMSLLGIGLKVATLPVIALGVGVGVDYGIYIYESLQHSLKQGHSLRESFYEAMYRRGTAAVFTAVTMSIGVGTWAFSALKFQADMGILLAFMFLVNVLGAIFLLPALACWLDVKPERKVNKTIKVETSKDTGGVFEASEMPVK